MKKSTVEDRLKEKIKTNPFLLKEAIIFFDRNIPLLDDQLIDSLLGIKQEEQNINYQKLEEQFGLEQYKYEGTPYDYIRRFLKAIQPSEDDVVYDLGSGYGRIVLYGALTTPANFKGIEIVPERVKKAQKIRQYFNIPRAEFLLGHAFDQDYSDGSIFFLFNPFSSSTLSQIGEKLKRLGKKREIKIASWGGPSTSYLLQQDWLKQLEIGRDKITNGTIGLKIFTST